MLFIIWPRIKYNTNNRYKYIKYKNLGIDKNAWGGGYSIQGKMPASDEIVACIIKIQGWKAVITIDPPAEMLP